MEFEHVCVICLEAFGKADAPSLRPFTCAHPMHDECAAQYAEKAMRPDECPIGWCHGVILRAPESWSDTILRSMVDVLGPMLILAMLSIGMACTIVSVAQVLASLPIQIVALTVLGHASAFLLMREPSHQQVFWFTVLVDMLFE